MVILCVPVFAAVSLVAFPSFRYQVFRVISEAPGIATFYSLRGKVVTRDFSAASALLQRQLDWSKRYDVDQSVQLPALMENTGFTLQAVVLEQERAQLVPYLKNLAAAYPGSYRTHLWVGEAQAYSSPREALTALEKAAKIVSTDTAIYRAAVAAAFQLGEVDLLRTWCRRYRTATAGGSHPFQFNPLAVGVGMRRVIAEVPNKKGSADLIEYNALVPNSNNVLEFSLPRAQPFEDVVLHFGTMPAVVLDVSTVTLSVRGTRTAQIADRLIMQSRNGFMIDDRRVMLTGTYGDYLRISWPDRGSIQADRIQVSARITRAPLINLPGCTQ